MGLAINRFQGPSFFGLWQSCLVQLPNAALGFASYQPDQCTRVPTIDNGDEDPNGLWTVLHLDPRAVWSDGEPVTADDYLFSQRLYADPKIYGISPYTLMRLTAPDSHTVVIHWSAPYRDFLYPLTELWPLPLHVYAAGQYAGIYDPKTGAYNSTLAQALLASPSYSMTIPVDDGPFTLQSFVPNDRAVLVRNPRFFSNFFHHPAVLDQITILSALRDFPASEVQAAKVTFAQLHQATIAAYRKGGLDVAEGMKPMDQLGGLPAREVIPSPTDDFVEYAFNQRSTAPNAGLNGGTSIFTDHAVRQAFVEAFDRCSAIRAFLGIHTCNDSNLFTNELTARPAPDYDSAFQLPQYDPAAAPTLLDRAGYPVVDHIRREKDGKTPLHLTLAVSYVADQDYSLAVRMQLDWERILQVDVTIVRGVKPSDPTGAYQTGAFDVWFLWESIFPDPVGNLLTQGGGWNRADMPSPQNPGGQNVLGLVDPYVVARDQLGSTIQDEGQRDEVYKSLQKYVTGLLDIVPTTFDVADVALVKPTVCNYQKSNAFGSGSNLWNVADWYVATSCPS